MEDEIGRKCCTHERGEYTKFYRKTLRKESTRQDQIKVGLNGVG
jgi:hypothetical protein